MNEQDRLIERLNRGEIPKTWEVEPGALVSALNAGLVMISENCDVELTGAEEIPLCISS